MKKQSNYKTGHLAEKIALLFLLLKGYQYVALNYTTGRGTGAGEIDLIVKKHHTLVFVEIKKRQTFMKAGEAITIKSQQRLMRGAQAFIHKHPQYQNHAIRFDAILFTKNLWPHHIKDAWRS